jgi:hypothetical protein
VGNGVETWRGRSHFTAGRGKNASEPVILELRARRHPLRAFRPGQIAAPAFAVLGAKFLLNAKRNQQEWSLGTDSS